MLGSKRTVQRAMVGWYDPRVLMHSAYQVAIANIFGRHSDTRLIEALASQPQAEFDYSQQTGDFWLDYVADTGDGWNSTFAIADALARPSLELEHQGRRESLAAGRVLVFGGDEVYPYPSRSEYEARTENPYRHAFAGRVRPDVLRTFSTDNFTGASIATCTNSSELMPSSRCSKALYPNPWRAT